MKYTHREEVPDELRLNEDPLILGRDITDYEVDPGEEAGTGSFVAVECDTKQGIPVYIQIGVLRTIFGGPPDKEVVVYEMGKDRVRWFQPDELKRITGPFLRSMETAALRSRVLERARVINTTSTRRGGTYSTIGQAMGQAMTGGAVGAIASAAPGGNILGTTGRRSENELKEMMEGEPKYDHGEIGADFSAERVNSSSIRESGSFSDFEEEVEKIQTMKEKIAEKKRQGLIDMAKEFWDKMSD